MVGVLPWGSAGDGGRDRARQRSSDAYCWRGWTLLFGKRNAKHDRRVSNLISSVDVFKLLFMLPQSRTHIPSWHLEAEAARRRYGERLAAQVRTYKWGFKKKWEAPADIRYCWNLLCVIVTWHVCLKWTWWPIIFLWCLLYSSRQAGNDLVGDVVCFLAKLIADPVLT